MKYKFELTKDLTIEDLTVGVASTDPVLGTGVFDKLMVAAKAHLTREYAEQRITGDSYAEAYIAMMQSVLQTASSFAVSSFSANMQRELSAEEKARIIAQTEQIKAQTLNVPKEGIILDHQADNLIKQGTQIDAQTSLIGKQELQVEAQTLNVPKEGELLDAQQAMVTNQADTEIKQALLVAANTAVATAQELLIDKQAITETEQAKLVTANTDLAISNKALTEQRKLTEEANINDIVNNNQVEGVIGRKNRISDEQVKAFETDNRAKAIKSLTDGFAVVATSDVTDIKDDTTGEIIKVVPDLYKQPAIDAALQNVWNNVVGSDLPIPPTPPKP